MTDHEQGQIEYLYIPNQDGVEEKFEIIFDFVSDEGQKYMFVTPAEVESDSEDEAREVLAFRYEEADDNLTLELIDENNTEEWDMVEEVFETMMAEADEL
ncbi:DUF1292 domain-containing protein [Hazenella sp. IB182357]|uniref:UPF0473 protein IC620_01715 n=1 Tax=Polycladospora coralii TaxID=2771432 RepID=A0A926N9N1_9BACL|nr:DUF1292 domain-containing protein [Polycladospora coralii]MBD1371075.1 DUF1292 domain-containing protein [Polycladospora coralii]MBS7530015.1 DUF1292 domain-containing protein [Polycladospora coralii]